MLKHKARMAITTGLALGMLTTITMVTPAIAETTDAAATVTVSNTNNDDILTPDANGDFTYTNDSGVTTTVHVVVSGNGSKDENTGNYTAPALTYDKSNDDITFKANFNPNQGGMAMTGYTKLDNAAGNYETNSWEDDYSDSLPYTIDENGVTHINVHDAFNISTQDIDGNEDKYGGVAATWMKSWAAYDNFKLQVNKGNGEYASNDPAVMFTPTAEDMGNGFTIPKASLPTKEGYHIKTFRTDKYNQNVPVNFTADGNAVLSLAELTHTRIMADGATRYSRADTWFNSITPIFEADEVTPTPTPQPEPTPEPEPQPTPEPTPTPNPEPENPPVPNNPDTPVVPDNPQPENPTTPVTPENPNTPQPETPVNPTTPETPSEPSEKPQKPSEESPKQSEQKEQKHATPNMGDNATSIAMLGGMILSGLTIIATARKMRR